MKKIKYKIYTLGCKVNQYDSEDLSRILSAADFIKTEEQADIAVVNTCCVTQTAISKCKRMINKAKSENPGSKIVVMGCWPVAYRDEAENLGFDLVWGVGDLDKLMRKITNNQETNHKQISNSKFQISNSERSRYFIKIQDGCEQFCSYCIVPYTRGELKSRPMQEIAYEVEQAVKAGYKEIVLSGVHLGLYGKDIKNQKSKIKNNLGYLLTKILQIKGLGRIRLSSIEITEVSDELIRLIAESNKICKHLAIPLQSGSDKILKLMNRPYDIKYFKNKINKVRKLIPDIAITTDVIVGFPGETDKDFKDSHDFIKDLGFSRLHVFPFSAHERTAAAEMKNKISRSVAVERAKKLRQLGKKLEISYKNKFIGEELDIVIENINKEILVGKTEYYFNIRFKRSQIIFKKSKANIKEFIKVRFDK